VGNEDGDRVHETDPATIRAAAAGDRRAFEALVREHQATVVRFVRHLVGDDHAEDVAQETFLRVHRRLGGFAHRSRFSTWLLQIARNAGVDELRRRARRDRVALVAPPPSPPSSPDVRAELRAALASLSPTIVEALVLVEVFGLGYEEAGRSLGVPTGTVKSRVFQARRKLHEWQGAGERAAPARTEDGSC
jgi:RNA polymerase sigma-70 factor (ECF subfamily)